MVEDTRKPVIPVIHMMDDAELFFALDEYRRSLGFTWKRFCLYGVAATISKNNDNPDLVIQIADYLVRKR